MMLYEEFLARVGELRGKFHLRGSRGHIMTITEPPRFLLPVVCEIVTGHHFSAVEVEKAAAALCLPLEDAQRIWRAEIKLYEIELYDGKATNEVRKVRVELLSRLGLTEIEIEPDTSVPPGGAEAPASVDPARLA